MNPLNVILWAIAALCVALTVAVWLIILIVCGAALAAHKGE